VLERYPGRDLHVTVVWLPMLVTDERSEWSPQVLPDRRVSEFWDEDRIAGTWLANENLGGLGYAGVVWDAYFLFGPDAVWSGRPSPLLASGSPVVQETGRLETRLRGLVG
jgi:hypothetical protein